MENYNHMEDEDFQKESLSLAYFLILGLILFAMGFGFILGLAFCNNG